VADERLIEDFWRHYRLSQSASRDDQLASDESFWAWEEIERVAQNPSADTIDLLVSLAEAAPDDQARCYLGAGPLEDFMLSHGPHFIEQIDQAAREHEHFRTALGCVWYGTPMNRGVVERFRDRFTS